MRERREYTILKRIGHYFLPVYPPVLIVTAVVAVILPNDYEGWGAWVNTSATLVVVALAVANLLAHHGKLCEWCAEATPLDPSGTAERKRRWLSHHHWEYDTKHRAPLITLGGFALATLVMWLTEGAWGDLAFFVFFATPTAISLTATKHHHRLQPWCPYCRRGRGDDEEVIKSPDPSPASA